MDARLYWASACPASAARRYHATVWEVLTDLTLTPVACRERRASVALRLNAAYAGALLAHPHRREAAGARRAGCRSTGRHREWQRWRKGQERRGDPGDRGGQR